jgi:predicted transcriptional regulator
MNNPLRRCILKAISDGGSTFTELQTRTGLDTTALQWHLRFLEHGSCVERVAKDERLVYRLTQEGQVIDFLDKDL